jgi:hypothetical protein
MNAMKVDVPRAYAYVSSPCLREGNSAVGDKNINSSTNDGSFNMDDMKNALHGLGGDGANGVIVMLKK